MKIVCDCGAVTEFVDYEDGPSFTEMEGWSKQKKGSMNISESHDQVYFYCPECDLQIWIFT